MPEPFLIDDSFPFAQFSFDFYRLKATARTVFNLPICFLFLIFGFFRLFIFYFLIIARNGCAADVPPRWAFVWGLLRRYVQQRGVRSSIFFYFFIFFVVV